MVSLFGFEIVWRSLLVMIMYLFGKVNVFFIFVFIKVMLMLFLRGVFLVSSWVRLFNVLCFILVVFDDGMYLGY